MNHKKLKILYGIQTTGNGHITRSYLLIKELIAEGHCIDAVLSGPENKLVSEIYSLPITITQQTGFTFQHQAGKLKKIKTLRSLDFKSFLKSIKTLGNLNDYDLIISDYEPITAWASKINKKISIGIGHQYAFTSKKAPFSKYHFLDKIILNHFAPTTINIGLHWFPFAKHILPPIIVDGLNIQLDNESGNLPMTSNFQLVYLPFEELRQLSNFFSAFTNENFVIFHPDVRQEECRQNITLKPLSRQNFISYLRHCEGIITNAGFELISEGLMLGKKIITKPLQGQAEQCANALALIKLQYADVMQKLDKQKLENWLNKKAYTKINFPNVAQLLAQWISKGNYTDIGSLSSDLWNRVTIERK